MVSWRAKKQLSLLLIVMVPVIAAAFLVVYQFLPAQSCFDTIQNQGELGVDCGGPCESCALKNPKTLTIFWARAVEVRENRFDAVAFVENANEVLSSPRIEYEFILFDALGPVGSGAGTTFILAQERTHVIETNIETTRTPSRVEFKVKSASWELDRGERFNVLVERRDYRVVMEDNRKFSTIETNVLNRSSFDLKEVDVYFTVLDDDANVLGANRVRVERLRAGESRLVKSIWPAELAGEVARIEVEPRVNIFDPDLILKPQ
jgi:hypothetical protein